MHWTGGAVAPGPVHWLTHFSLQCQYQCVGGYHLLSSLFESVTSGLLTNIREIVTLTQDLFRSVHLKQKQVIHYSHIRDLSTLIFYSRFDRELCKINCLLYQREQSVGGQR